MVEERMRGSQRARELGAKKERDIGNKLKFKKMNSWKANLKFSPNHGLHLHHWLQ